MKKIKRSETGLVVEYLENISRTAIKRYPEINAFLTHLAVKEKVSASTQNQALCALLFLWGITM